MRQATKEYSNLEVFYVDEHGGCVTIESPDIEPIHDSGVVSKLHEAIDEILVGHELEDFSLTDIKMLSQILKHKVV